MERVILLPRELSRLAEVIGPERTAQIVDTFGSRARIALQERAVVHISSTAVGGGVAEMLPNLLGYALDAGVDVRWLVIEGSPDFFALTKRLHNHIHGSEGDGGPLGPEEHEIYRSTLEREAEDLRTHVRPGDIVVIHDPQPAGLAEAVREAGAHAVWRCHIGSDEQTAASDGAWEFLRPYLEPYVEHWVFSHREFAPDWVREDALTILAPSIDPFSPKNQELSPEVVEGILTHVGLVAGRESSTTFQTSAGSPSRVERHCDLTRAGPAPGPDVPLIVQISRWDRLKDMAGVMRGFVDYVDSGRDAHLVLAGPGVKSVADDPEAVAVLDECLEMWRGLPHPLRARVTLACLPMRDPDENAVIVNALQRHATVIVQKSLAEGYGLTVAEALFKARPVVASAVGGIREQIVHGESGLLVEDPRDLACFGEQVVRLLEDPQLGQRLGTTARERIIEERLIDTSLERWLGVMLAVVEA